MTLPQESKEQVAAIQQQLDIAASQVKEREAAILGSIDKLREAAFPLRPPWLTVPGHWQGDAVMMELKKQLDQQTALRERVEAALKEAEAKLRDCDCDCEKKDAALAVRTAELEAAKSDTEEQARQVYCT